MCFRQASYNVAGYRCRVVTEVGLIGEYVHSCLVPFLDEKPSGFLPTYELLATGGRYRSHLDGATLADTPTVSYPLLQLLWRIHFEAFPRISDRVGLHAGAVSIGGKGVVLPGTSGAGKSTLVAGLVLAGAEYLSDEVALLARGVVGAVPRALGLKRSSLELFEGLAAVLPAELLDDFVDQCFVPPDRLRVGAVGSTAPVELVIFPAYGPDKTVVEPMRRALSVSEMAQNAFNLDRFGGSGLEELAEVAARSRSYRLATGVLQEAVEAVFDLVGEKPALAQGRRDSCR